MGHIPGIVFTDSPTGRQAAVAGTGLKVWLIVDAFRRMDEDWQRLRDAYHWLSEDQLRAALAYAEAYPDEIERAIQKNERWTPEVLYAAYPFTRPGAR